MYTSIFNLLSNIFFSLGRKSLLSQTWSTKQEDTTATAVAGMVAASSRKSAAVPARCAWVGLLMFATLPTEDHAHTYIWMDRPAANAKHVRFVRQKIIRCVVCTVPKLFTAVSWPAGPRHLCAYRRPADTMTNSAGEEHQSSNAHTYTRSNNVQSNECLESLV